MTIYVVKGDDKRLKRGNREEGKTVSKRARGRGIDAGDVLTISPLLTREYRSHGQRSERERGEGDEKLTNC